ncbi:MAG: hypothetical protein JXA09_07465 [Anaerolineae bacterium]|nr:hypothetical protein [Anaerolineae bacterium]
MIDIGTRTELFVDRFLIDRLEGAELLLQRPERREVAFQLDQPWEDDVGFFLSVVQEGDSVRLYYRAGMPDRGDEELHRIGIAESTDGGLSFTRPDLGLVDYAGSKRNNLIFAGGPPRVPPVFLDTNPHADPAQRYKGLSAAWKRLYAMGSPDGIHWQPIQREPLQVDGTFDTVNTAFWDRLAGCYRSFTRYFENLDEGSTSEDVLGPKPTVVRAIQSSTSPDFVHWTPVVPHQYADGQPVQLYTNATIPCPGAEHIYLAFPNRYVQTRTPSPDHGVPGVNDALFMASRDCVHWTRYLDAWVRPGLDDLNWTDRNNYPTWGLVQTSPTEWSMYISEHYRHPGVPVRMRRLSVRPHGFVSLHAPYSGGACVTKPFLFRGDTLHLNYATSAAGAVWVEVQHASGAPVDGYALTDLEPLYGDALDRPVTWAGGKDLGALRGEPIRLRFVLKDADVFAFAFR